MKIFGIFGPILTHDGYPSLNSPHIHELHMFLNPYFSLLEFLLNFHGNSLEEGSNGSYGLLLDTYQMTKSYANLASSIPFLYLSSTAKSLSNHPSLNIFETNNVQWIIVLEMSFIFHYWGSQDLDISWFMIVPILFKY